MQFLHSNSAYLLNKKHAAFENGDLSIDEAKEMLLDDFTADEINELIEIYSSF